MSDLQSFPTGSWGTRMVEGKVEAAGIEPRFFPTDATESHRSPAAVTLGRDGRATDKVAFLRSFEMKAITFVGQGTESWQLPVDDGDPSWPHVPTLNAPSVAVSADPCSGCCRRSRPSTTRT